MQSKDARLALPIACTLAPGELSQRREELLPGLIRQATAIADLENGVALTFAASSDVLQLITRMIDAERQCCRFFRFQLTIEPDGGPLRLDVTGPPGTRDFLDGLTAK